MEAAHGECGGMCLCCSVVELHSHALGEPQRMTVLEGLEEKVRDLENLVGKVRCFFFQMCIVTISIVVVLLVLGFWYSSNRAV